MSDTDDGEAIYLRIAVCDDEKIFRDEIIDSLYAYFGRLDLDCIPYEDGSRLLNAYGRGESFDALFMDIEMPDTDGMTAAARLREAGIEAPVIFLTSHTEMAMEGYEVSAFRFLAKPIDKGRLLRTLDDLKEELCEKKRLLIRYEGETVILNVDDIVYVEAMNNSISIVLVDGEYTIRKKFADIERELAELSDSFIRIHRGYIVNLAHVKKYHGNNVIVSEGKVLPISRTMAGEFKSRLFEYVKFSAR